MWKYSTTAETEEAKWPEYVSNDSCYVSIMIIKKSIRNGEVTVSAQIAQDANWISCKTPSYK